MKINLLMLFVLISLCVQPASVMAAVQLPATGQITSYQNGDDGALRKGATATRRFTDNGNGTVTDNLNGLIWLKNANCYGIKTWANALSQVKSIAHGACGLSDGSTAGAWRLPNINELESLVDLSAASPSLPTGHPFGAAVQLDFYWSSTTNAGTGTDALGINFDTGILQSQDKALDYYLWPVKASSSTVYSVNFSAGANGSINGPANQNVTGGTATTTVTAIASSGYHFVNWTGTGFSTTSANPLTITSVTGNLSITANFASDPVINGVCGASNGGSFDAAPTTNLCSSGAPTSLTGSGLVADPWKWSCLGQNTGATNSTCSALISDTKCGASNGQTFLSAPSTNLCETGIASSVTGSGPWSWTCAWSSGAGSVTCKSFPKKYTVIFIAGFGGTVSGTTNQTVNPGGNTTTVTAVPTSSAYHFVNWSGANGFTSTSNPLTLTGVSADLAITASFAVAPGDCDASGTVTVAEVQKALNMFFLADPQQIEACVDTNGDHAVSIAEVQRVIFSFLGL